MAFSAVSSSGGRPTGRLLRRREADVDRTTADGKASSVQFVHFPFADDQVEKFQAPGARAVIGFGHPAYAHMAVLPEETRQALAEDFA